MRRGRRRRGRRPVDGPPRGRSARRAAAAACRGLGAGAMWDHPSARESRGGPTGAALANEAPTSLGCSCRQMAPPLRRGPVVHLLPIHRHAERKKKKKPHAPPQHKHQSVRGGSPDLAHHHPATRRRQRASADRKRWVSHAPHAGWRCATAQERRTLSAVGRRSGSRALARWVPRERARRSGWAAEVCNSRAHPL